MISDNEVIHILYNDCYGGWSPSNEVKELYMQRTNNKLNNLCKRHDPILIQIYKELGFKFDAKYSKTAIKTIHKKYEEYYYITELDGCERIKIDYKSYELNYLKNYIKEIIDNKDIDNNEKINLFSKLIG